MKRSFNKDNDNKVPCDYPDCHEEGTCKAPKDRSLKEYYMFCPYHAKMYNEKWDYYADMSPEEIEKSLREDTTWHRPTWKFSGRYNVKDPLHLLHGFDFFRETRETRPSDDEEIKALSILNLEYPVSFTEIKNRYRELAKKYHPDKTGGNREKEQIFKKILQAYKYLQKKYSKNSNS